MRAVLQRVKEAKVMVDGKAVGEIKRGILALLGVGKADTEEDAAWIADKIVNLRIFEDDEGKMNRSLLEIGGELLIVSQFTLYGDARKGRRPSFTEAAPPDLGERLYEKVVENIRTKYGLKVETGIFGALMDVHLVNWGPVTILLDSKKLF